MEDFKRKFLVKELLIFEGEFWNWSLRPKQPTIGSSIVSLKRHATTVSDITSEEWNELLYIFKLIEERCKKVFSHNVINYLMLMLVDKQIHYHVLPRFDSSTDFNGYLYDDKFWPNPIDFSQEQKFLEVSNNLQTLIITALKNEGRKEDKK